MTTPNPDTLRPCVRGCTRPGTEDDPQVKPATHGNYCASCHGRIFHALIQAPELAAHILGNVVPAGGQAGDRVDESKDAPLPFNQSAFADVNELYRWLAYWCDTWAEYLEIRTPAPAARSWRRQDGTLVGLPPGVDPRVAARDVGLMTRWLCDRLDTILTLAPEDVDEFDTGIREVWRLNARWPRLEKPRYSNLPCPATGCDARIAVYPPAEPGAVKAVACDNGHYYPEEEYDELAVQLVAQRLEAARQARVKGGRARQAAGRTEQQKAADVRAHLWRKYGGTAREEPAS